MLIWISIIRSLLEDLSRFFQYQSTDGFIKSLIMKDERIAQIEDYYHRIETSFSLFEECAKFIV